jgi:hypothetical protein
MVHYEGHSLDDYAQAYLAARGIKYESAYR